MKSERFWNGLAILVLIAIASLTAFHLGKAEFGKEFTLIIQNETGTNITLRGEEKDLFGRFDGNYDFVVEKETSLTLKGVNGKTRLYNFGQVYNLYSENPVTLGGINLYVTSVNNKVIIANVTWVGEQYANVKVTAEIVNDTTVKLIVIH